LLVEDSDVLLDAMTKIFVRAGYQVLTAASAHDAMGVLRTPLQPIDVVILDVNLPDVSGAHLCAKIRELYPTAKVVVCTGEASPEEADQLMRLGVHRYFLKPVGVEELLAAVESALPSRPEKPRRSPNRR
jgi:two-component system, NtrC family, nitrogen regulation response regulator NtrX